MSTNLSRQGRRMVSAIGVLCVLGTIALIVDAGVATVVAAIVLLGVAAVIAVSLVFQMIGEAEERDRRQASETTASRDA